MDNKASLAHSNEWNEIEKSSPRPSWKLMLARKLDTAAAMTGKELISGESRLWLKALSGQPEEAIEYGFDQYFLTGGKFFPQPAEILELIRSWHRIAREKAEERHRRGERAEVEKRRASGECIGFADILLEYKKRQKANYGPVPASN